MQPLIDFGEKSSNVTLIKSVRIKIRSGFNEINNLNILLSF